MAILLAASKWLHPQCQLLKQLGSYQNEKSKLHQGGAVTQQCLTMNILVLVLKKQWVPRCNAPQARSWREEKVDRWNEHYWMFICEQQSVLNMLVLSLNPWDLSNNKEHCFQNKRVSKWQAAHPMLSPGAIMRHSPHFQHPMHSKMHYNPSDGLNNCTLSSNMAPWKTMFPSSQKVKAVPRWWCYLRMFKSEH